MAFRLGDAVLFFGGDTSDLDKKFEQTEGKAKGFGSRAAGFIGGAVATGAAAAGAAIVSIGVAALNVSNDTDAAARQIQASLGTTREEAERLAEISRSIFGDNFGENVQEAGAAVSFLSKHLKDAVGSEEELTKKAFMISDAFGPPVEEVIEAVATLTNEFEDLDPTQAFDLVAAGFQRGLDKSGDFLDSIGEYSNLFDDAGFSADQFFSIMETGSAGGVLGTDKIADAVKEMGVRLNENAKGVSEAFTAMGLDFAAIQGQVASGDATWADYFDEIVGGLEGIEDPLARSQAQIAIFGTMAEDLGVSFTEGLDAGITKLAEMEGAADSLSVQYGTLGAIWRDILVQVSIIIDPLKDKLFELATTAMPLVKSAAQKIADFLKGDFKSGAEETKGVLEAISLEVAPVAGAIRALIDEIKVLWEQYGPAVLAALAVSWSVAMAVVRFVLNDVKDVLSVVTSFLKGDWKSAWDTVRQNLANRVRTIWRMMRSIVSAIKTSFSQVDWGAIGTGLMLAVVLAAGMVWNLFVDAVSGAWQLLKDAWNALDWGAIGTAFMDAIALAAGIAWNLVVAGAEAAWQLLKDAWSALDWGAIGTAFMDAIALAAGTAWNLVVAGAEAAWQLLKDAWAALDWGAIGTAFMDAIAFAAGIAWNLVVAGAEAAWQLLKDAWAAVDWGAIGTALMDAIAFAAGIAWNLVVAGAEAAWLLLKDAWNALDWGAIGTALMDAIAFAAGIAWNLVVAGAEAAWQLLKDAWAALDWGAIGTAFMDAIALAAGIAWNLVVAGAEAAWQLLKDAWNALDWGAIGTALVDAIALAAGIAWNLVVAGAEAAWQLLKDAWAALDWGAIGTALMDAIAFAAGIAWNLIVAGASGAWQLLKDAWNALDWAAIGTAFMDAIKDAASTAWEALLNTGEGSEGGIGKWFSDLKSKFQEMEWATIGADIGGAIVDGINKAVLALAGGIDILSEFIAGADGAAAAESIVNFVDSAVGGADAQSPLSKLVAAIFNLLKEAFQYLYDFLITLIPGLYDILAEEMAALDWGAIGADLMMAIVVAAGFVWQLFLASASAIWQFLKDAWAELDWGVIGTNLMQLIRDAAEAVWNALVAYVPQLFNLIGLAFAVLDWPSIGTNLMQLVRTAAEAVWAALVAYATTLYQNLSDKFDEIDWAAVGTALMDAITAAAIAAWSTIVNSATRLYLRFKNKFSEIDWKSIGINIINGIKNGVLGAAAGLGRAAAAAAKSALDHAKSFLGIQSPSLRAAEEIGRPLGAGIAMGIDKEARGIAETLEAALRGALDGQAGVQPAAAGVGPVQLTVYQSFNGSPDSPATISRASGTGLLDALQRLGLPG